MTGFYLLLIIGVAILIILLIKKSRVKQPPYKNIEIETHITANGEQFHIAFTEEPDLKQRNIDNSILLNPEGIFKLHIYDINKQNLTELEQLLEINDFFEATRKIQTFAIKHGIGCIEIDDYVKEFRPIFLSKLDELLRNNPEYVTANNEDKKDIFIECKRIALQTINVRPDVDVIVLFDHHGQHYANLRNLFNDYPEELLIKYFEFKQHGKTVKKISADDYYRQDYEKLVKNDLAMRGKEIGIENILDSLKMEELKKIAQKENIKLPNRKGETIEILKSQEFVWNYINEKVSLRELFVLEELPEKYEVDYRNIAQVLEYFFIFADLIHRTYQFGKEHHLDNLKLAKELENKVKISVADDNRTCPFCRSMNNKVLSAEIKNIPPFHLSCRCSYSAEYDLNKIYPM